VVDTSLSSLSWSGVSGVQTGYGSSSGECPSEEDAYADVQAAYHWALLKAPNTQVQF
jgi:hypothetical protein